MTFETDLTDNANRSKGVWARGRMAELLNRMGSALNSGGGGGGVTELTSRDNSVTITDPTGPAADLSVPTGASVQLLHVAFPFAFDTAGLAAGVPITGWTPADGDLIYDAWPEILTVWDGTTPLCDFTLDATPGGFGIGSNFGPGVWDMTAAQAAIAAGCQAGGGTLRPLSGVLQIMPHVVAAATPLLFVSQTATLGGADPGATQGSAVFHVLILPAAAAVV